MLDFGIVLKTVTPSKQDLKDLLMNIFLFIITIIIMIIFSIIIAVVSAFVFNCILFPIFGTKVLFILPLTLAYIFGKAIIWNPLYYRYQRLKNIEKVIV